MRQQLIMLLKTHQLFGKHNNILFRFNRLILLLLIIFIFSQLVLIDINKAEKYRNTVKSDLIWVSEYPNNCEYWGLRYKWLLNQCQTYQLGTVIKVTSRQHKQTAKQNLTQKSLKVDDYQLISPKDNSWLFWFERISFQIIAVRNRLLEELRVWLGRNEGLLTFSFIFGGSDLLEKSVQNDINQLGLSHLVAASGLQVGFLVYWVNLLPFPTHRNWRAAVQTAAIWLYAWLALFSPSILRATIAESVFIVVQLLQRKSQILWSIGLALVVTQLLAPALLQTVGFQLSLAATLGIILMGGHNPLAQIVTSGSFTPQKQLGKSGRLFWFRALKNYVISSGWISLVAQIWTAPLILYYFNQINPWGIVTTLLVGWLALPIFNLGLLWTAIVPVMNVFAWLSPLQLALSQPLTSLASFFVWSVETLARQNIKPWELKLNGSWYLWLWYGCLFLLVYYRHRRAHQSSPTLRQYFYKASQPSLDRAAPMTVPAAINTDAGDVIGVNSFVAATC